jgi:hypothetical protein
MRKALLISALAIALVGGCDSPTEPDTTRDAKSYFDGQKGDHLIYEIYEPISNSTQTVSFSATGEAAVDGKKYMAYYVVPNSTDFQDTIYYRTEGSRIYRNVRGGVETLYADLANDIDSTDGPNVLCYERYIADTTLGSGRFHDCILLSAGWKYPTEAILARDVGVVLLQKPNGYNERLISASVRGKVYP